MTDFTLNKTGGFEEDDYDRCDQCQEYLADVEITQDPYVDYEEWVYLCNACYDDRDED